MAASIDATVGDAAANSYATQAAATSYFDARLNSDAWDDATSDEQARSLIMATRRLDQEFYLGRKYTSDQALQWPRSGVYDYDGRLYGTDEIPDRLKRAQYELAFYLLSDTTLLDDTGLEGYDRVQIGNLDVDTRPRTGGTLPANVVRELGPLLREGVANIQLQRG